MFFSLFMLVLLSPLTETEDVTLRGTLVLSDVPGQWFGTAEGPSERLATPWLLVLDKEHCFEIPPGLGEEGNQIICITTIQPLGKLPEELPPEGTPIQITGSVISAFTHHHQTRLIQLSDAFSIPKQDKK
ncbi:MAG: hypothetical protein JKY60_16575 [Kordiimonadaceae bacterium]|nr:hypothetical protein [Kordiimonadaceae bacterium]